MVIRPGYKTFFDNIVKIDDIEFYEVLDKEEKEESESDITNCDNINLNKKKKEELNTSNSITTKYVTNNRKNLKACDFCDMIITKIDNLTTLRTWEEFLLRTKYLINTKSNTNNKNSQLFENNKDEFFKTFDLYKFSHNFRFIRSKSICKFCILSFFEKENGLTLLIDLVKNNLPLPEKMVSNTQILNININNQIYLNVNDNNTQNSNNEFNTSIKASSINNISNNKHESEKYKRQDLLNSNNSSNKITVTKKSFDNKTANQPLTLNNQNYSNNLSNSSFSNANLSEVVNVTESSKLDSNLIFNITESTMLNTEKIRNDTINNNLGVENEFKLKEILNHVQSQINQLDEISKRHTLVVNDIFKEISLYISENSSRIINFDNNYRDCIELIKIAYNQNLIKLSPEDIHNIDIVSKVSTVHGYLINLLSHNLKELQGHHGVIIANSSNKNIVDGNVYLNYGTMFATALIKLKSTINVAFETYCKEGETLDLNKLINKNKEQQ